MCLLLKQFTLQTYRSCFVIRCSSRFFVSKIGTIHDNSNNGQSIGFRRLETRCHPKRRHFVQLAIQATGGPQVAERLSFRSNTTFTYMPWSRRLVFSDPKFDLHEDFFMGLDIDALHTQRCTNFSSHRNCAFLALHQKGSRIPVSIQQKGLEEKRSPLLV